MTHALSGPGPRPSLAVWVDKLALARLFQARHTSPKAWKAAREAVALAGRFA